MYMHRYAFTLRKNTQPVFIKDYEDAFAYMNRLSYRTVTYHYESTAGLHAHGVITSTKKVFIKNVCPGEGWHMDLKSEPDEGWDKYITKDSHLEGDLLTREWNLYSEYLIIERQRESEFIHDVTRRLDYLSDDGCSSLCAKLKRKKINLFKRLKKCTR